MGPLWWMRVGRRFGVVFWGFEGWMANMAESEVDYRAGVV
jgi:hypothetical protein